jgi:hypothetical protein
MKQIERETKVSNLRIVDGGRSKKGGLTAKQKLLIREWLAANPPPLADEAGIHIRPGVFTAAEERIIRRRLLEDAPHHS